MKFLFPLIMCLLSIPLQSYVLPYLSFRSQGFNAARELVGWQAQINKANMCQFYTSCNVATEYVRSFWPGRLSACLFGDALIESVSRDACCKHESGKVIKIQGTKKNNRDPRAFMAENFYLPTDFSSEICFDPVLDNVIADLNLYIGLDNWYQGLYFRIHAPICRTRWNLNFNEHVLDIGKNNYDPGYFNDTFFSDQAVPSHDPDVYGLERSRLLNSFTEYVCGCRAISDVPGILFQPLENARMSSNWLKATHIAELTAAFGWNFLLGNNYHAGISARIAAPTGNAPQGKCIFEPIVGNGHHWEVGAGLTGHWRCWAHECELRDFSIYVDANITHLCKTLQNRTFDLCGKPLSRYMLAMKFTSSVNNLLASDDDVKFKVPAAQFAKEFVPLANITTIPVYVSAAVQADLVVKCAYTHGNFQWDVGYDFWSRSCEKIGMCKSAYTRLSENMWGLKGNAFVFGFPYDPVVGAPLQPGVPLSATQSNATIFSGTNDYPTVVRNGVTYNWNQNSTIDHPVLAYNQTHQQLQTHTIGTISVTNVFDQVATSLNPIVISPDDLDLSAGNVFGVSHKLFTHFEWIPMKYYPWTPYVGVGAEIEFGQHSPTCFVPCTMCSSDNQSNCVIANYSSSCINQNIQDCCQKKCCTNSCLNCSVSQWGVWLKVGFSYR